MCVAALNEQIVHALICCMHIGKGFAEAQLLALSCTIRNLPEAPNVFTMPRQ